MRVEVNRFIVKLKLFTYNYRLVELRRLKNLTLKDLSLQSGVYLGRLSDIELLKDMPTEYEKDYIAGGLESDPIWLFPPELVKFQAGQRELCLSSEDVKRLQCARQLI